MSVLRRVTHRYPALEAREQRAWPTPFIDVISALRPFSSLDHPREVIRQFTAELVRGDYGDRILSLALPQLPYLGPMLHGTGEALWFLNIAMFTIFVILYASRWILFADEAETSLPTTSCLCSSARFRGTCDIITVALCLAFPISATDRADRRALWWIDVALAVSCGVLVRT